MPSIILRPGCKVAGRAARGAAALLLRILDGAHGAPSLRTWSVGRHCIFKWDALLHRGPELIKSLPGIVHFFVRVTRLELILEPTLQDCSLVYCHLRLWCCNLLWRHLLVLLVRKGKLRAHLCQAAGTAICDLEAAFWKARLNSRTWQPWCLMSQCWHPCVAPTSVFTQGLLSCSYISKLSICHSRLVLDSGCWRDHLKESAILKLGT
mmetsp:Transcript_13349/g.25193  ORF Transcript_13349/g.25193 Transcript_13349/m.25193 type:complete len:208 (-) Transcript_13349:174-797(-)